MMRRIELGSLRIIHIIAPLFLALGYWVYLIINALQRVLREYVGFFPAPSVSRVSANLLTAV